MNSELNEIMELNKMSVKMENIQYNDIFFIDSLSVWNELTENSDYFYMNQHLNKLFCPISQLTQNKIDYIPLEFYGKKKTVQFVENEKGVLEKVKRPYIKKMKKVVCSETSPKDKLLDNNNSIKIKKTYKKKNKITTTNNISNTNSINNITNNNNITTNNNITINNINVNNKM